MVRKVRRGRRKYRSRTVVEFVAAPVTNKVM